eukprot:CAMPEP_0197689328 /NCGR_PEP_ID=MMETSP1338-20131121/106678_1 /TAXON_ID=43686 ORGANISM="Pelagodinium beii, Strain RCC1491" /NCGR_SAMPLE_ID=MMETSP1338 /ASSEMBLY_ACC=CAM_ASM_000754 /LENGTH=356 /DNA_ID=CAMNT_0043271651 /DNA_START=34 /DNA_END=1100 /DNA_ORIENTATION=+
MEDQPSYRCCRRRKSWSSQADLADDPEDPKLLSAVKSQSLEPHAQEIMSIEKQGFRAEEGKTIAQQSELKVRIEAQQVPLPPLPLQEMAVPVLPGMSCLDELLTVDPVLAKQLQDATQRFAAAHAALNSWQAGTAAVNPEQGQDEGRAAKPPLKRRGTGGEVLKVGFARINEELEVEVEDEDEEDETALRRAAVVEGSELGGSPRAEADSNQNDGEAVSRNSRAEEDLNGADGEKALGVRHLEADGSGVSEPLAGKVVAEEASVEKSADKDWDTKSDASNSTTAGQPESASAQLETLDVMAAPPRDTWTASERRSYVASRTSSRAARQVMEEFLAETPLPQPWVCVKASSGKTFFA